MQFNSSFRQSEIRFTFADLLYYFSGAEETPIVHHHQTRDINQTVNVDNLSTDHSIQYVK